MGLLGKKATKNNGKSNIRQHSDRNTRHASRSPSSSRRSSSSRDSWRRSKRRHKKKYNNEEDSYDDKTRTYDSYYEDDRSNDPSVMEQISSLPTRATNSIESFLRECHLIDSDSYADEDDEVVETEKVPSGKKLKLGEVKKSVRWIDQDVVSGASVATASENDFTLLEGDECRNDHASQYSSIGEIETSARESLSLQETPSTSQALFANDLNHHAHWKIRQQQMKVQQHKLQTMQLEDSKPIVSFRLFSFFGGVSLVISSIVTDIMARQAGNMREIMEIFVSIYLILFGLLTCLLESGDISSKPSTFSNYCCSFRCVTHIRMSVLKNATFLRHPIGRSLFYIFLGTISFSQANIPSFIAGGYVVFIGIAWAIVGVFLEKRLESVFRGFDDEEMLIQIYREHENEQGMLDEKGFLRIVRRMDPDLTKIEAYAAFLELNVNRDGHVEFEDWRRWVMVGRRKHGFGMKARGSKEVGLVCYEI